FSPGRCPLRTTPFPYTTLFRSKGSSAVEQGSQGEERAQRGRCDHVVPAAVPHPGQRVVLGGDRHLRPGGAGAELGGERGRDATGAALDRDAGLAQRRGERLQGVELAVAELWVGVQVTGERVQLVGQRLGALADAAGQRGRGS